MTAHVPTGGAPAHASATVPLNPIDEAISSEYVACCPAEIGSLTGCPGAASMQKSIAVPLTGTLCGLPGALSFRISVAVRAPLPAPHVAPSAGAKANWMEHVAPGGVLAPMQESAVTAKSPGFVPPLVTELIVSAPAKAPVLLFVTVTGCAVPDVPASCGVNAKLAGSEIPDCVTAPLSATVWGVPVGMLSVADCAPGGVPVAGLNDTLIWQFAPAAKVGAQGLLRAKSAAFTPVTVIALIPAALLPVFEIVTT